MKKVGVRALKQNASAVVAEAAGGEVILITDRGRPVAQLVPVATSELAALVAAGRARLPKRSLSELGDPPAPGPGQEPLSSVIAAMRDDERY